MKKKDGNVWRRQQGWHINWNYALMLCYVALCCNPCWILFFFFLSINLSLGKVRERFFFIICCMLCVWGRWCCGGSRWKIFLTPINWKTLCSQKGKCLLSWGFFLSIFSVSFLFFFMLLYRVHIYINFNENLWWWCCYNIKENMYNICREFCILLPITNISSRSSIAKLYSSIYIVSMLMH